MKSVFKGFILLIFALILIPHEVKAQDWEYGVSVGTSGYMGNYNPDNIFKFNSLSGSVGAKYNFNPTWGIRANVSEIGIKWNNGFDTERRMLGEISVFQEFNFFKFEPNTKKAAYTPYVFAGIGGVFFQDLFRPIIPFGAGFKYNLKSNFTIDSHLNYRLAGTDRLDGKVSGRKEELLDKINHSDSYMTFQIGLTYTFFKQGCPTW